MKLLGKKAPKKTITCFVPLNENPKNHSSIEFAILKNKKVLTHQKVGLFNKGIKTKIDKKKRFNLNLGDALVFDDRILHRGLANHSGSDRWIAYFSYMRPRPNLSRVCDTHFESNTSVFD